MSARHVGEPAARLRHDPDMFPVQPAEIGRGSAGTRRNYRMAVRKRSALPITQTELTLMAALAIIGFSSKPNAG